MSTPKIKLNRFEVSNLDPSNTQLYANGRQQSVVEVLILKEKWDEDQERWVPVPLSSTERAKLTLVKFSSDLNQTVMPADWFVDTEGNDFFQGPFTPSLAEADAGADAKAEATLAPAREPRGTKQANFDSVAEYHERFVRTTFVGSAKLMARVVLDDGQVLTTNMVSPNHNFSSYVTLRGVTPFAVDASQLTLKEEVLIEDTTTGRAHQKVVGYFWKMPTGLKIYSNTALSQPDFSGVFFIKRTGDSQGCRGRSYSGPPYGSPAQTKTVWTSEGFGYSYHPPSVSYSITLVREQITADFLSFKNVLSFHLRDNSGGLYEVIDMYGNEHFFRVDPSSDHSTLTIASAQRPSELPQGRSSDAEPVRENKE